MSVSSVHLARTVTTQMVLRLQRIAQLLTTALRELRIRLYALTALTLRSSKTDLSLLISVHPALLDTTAHWAFMIDLSSAGRVISA